MQASHEKELQNEKQKYVTSFWTKTEKDNALAKCRLGLRAWRAKKPMLCLHAVTDEDGHSLENEDESDRRLCEYRSTIFDGRIEVERHHCHETILRYVQKAPDDIRWKIDRNEFDELMATKKNPLQVPTGIFLAKTGALEGWAPNSFTTRTNT